eukprot:8602357-Pyramimonas_sp.AAC.1
MIWERTSHAHTNEGCPQCVIYMYIYIYIHTNQNSSRACVLAKAKPASHQSADEYARHRTKITTWEHLRCRGHTYLNRVSPPTSAHPSDGSCPQGAPPTAPDPSWHTPDRD